jgi:TPR repeat protein
MILRSSSFRVIAVCAIAAASVAAQGEDFASVQGKAQAGDARAQYYLAKDYIGGTGVARDPVQGLAWLRKSADQGYFGAEYALGYMYLNGAEKLPKDEHEAAKWFRKAAKQQNKASQDKLAAMLAQGLISSEEADWRATETTAAQTPPQTLPRTLPSPAKDAKGKAAPFSLGEVETGLSGGITSKRMTTLVQKFGVDFRLNAAARKHLADQGADDNLLTTISASKRSL